MAQAGISLFAGGLKRCPEMLPSVFERRLTALYAGLTNSKRRRKMFPGRKFRRDLLAF
jgi:hypothetical protein